MVQTQYFTQSYLRILIKMYYAVSIPFCIIYLDGKDKDFANVKIYRTTKKLTQPERRALSLAVLNMMKKWYVKNLYSPKLIIEFDIEVEENILNSFEIERMFCMNSGYLAINLNTLVGSKAFRTLNWEDVKIVPMKPTLKKLGRKSLKSLLVKTM